MSKLAVYDKNRGRADRRITSFFRTDYIYRRNFMARLTAFFGCAIVLSFVLWHKITIDHVDIGQIDFRAFAVESAFFAAVVMIIYTAVSSVKAMREYDEANARQKKYYSALGRLDEKAVQAERPARSDGRPGVTYPGRTGFDTAGAADTARIDRARPDRAGTD